MPRFLIVVLAVLASLVTPVFADDWVAQKLRGTVLELVDGAWQPIERGAAVPEAHVVRTLGNARVLFVRGNESVELGPDTQVQFFLRKRDRFTTVKQYFGEVTVEADVELVKHFAVQTPHLVAVVKGTIFTVLSDELGASVEVSRGAVAVHSKGDHSSVTVRAGQEVRTSDNGALEVSGKGTLPAVVDRYGKPVATAIGVDKVKAKTNNGKSGDNPGKGNAGKGNAGNGNPGTGGNSGNHTGGSDDDD